MVIKIEISNKAKSVGVELTYEYADRELAEKIGTDIKRSGQYHPNTLEKPTEEGAKGRVEYVHRSSLNFGVPQKLAARLAARYKDQVEYTP